MSVRVSVIVLVIVTSKADPVHPVYAAEESLAARWRALKAAGSSYRKVLVDLDHHVGGNQHTRCSPQLQSWDGSDLRDQCRRGEQRDTVEDHFGINVVIITRIEVMN
jgi:hypothetical protein